MLEHPPLRQILHQSIHWWLALWEALESRNILYLQRLPLIPICQTSLMNDLLKMRILFFDGRRINTLDERSVCNPRIRYRVGYFAEVKRNVIVGN